MKKRHKNMVNYTKGALSTISRVNLPNGQWLKDVTDDLKQKLNDTFIHSVDPSYAGDQNKFNEIHKPEPGKIQSPLNYPPGVRC